MKINVPQKLFTGLNKIGQAINSIKSDVILPAGESALADVKHIIETDESAAASGRTNNKTAWNPIKGRRTKQDTMYETLSLKEKNNGVSVGWDNAEDYYESQNLGWGSQGSGQQPEDALFENVKGAGFMEAGYESANGEVDKRIKDLVTSVK
ncbi:MAG: hypothetical protein LBT91_02735 [Bifidobacteriaceae bacterium]|jgi:hypothetical protein|nr:hypothetical protein [Bifidobacteriaceae bacterium]